MFDPMDSVCVHAELTLASCKFFWCRCPRRTLVLFGTHRHLIDVRRMWYQKSRRCSIKFLRSRCHPWKLMKRTVLLLMLELPEKHTPTMILFCHGMIRQRCSTHTCEEPLDEYDQTKDVAKCCAYSFPSRGLFSQLEKLGPCALLIGFRNYLNSVCGSRTSGQDTNPFTVPYWFFHEYHTCVSREAVSRTTEIPS